MDNLYYDDVNVRLPLCILLRQKEILGLLEKKIFQVVNSKAVPINIRVFNSQFIEEIKIADINKAW